jgi:hypothetical protein
VRRCCAACSLAAAARKALAAPPFSLTHPTHLTVSRQNALRGPLFAGDRDPYLFIDPATGNSTTVKQYDEM